MHFIIVLERLKIVVKAHIIQFMKKTKQISLLRNCMLILRRQPEFLTDVKSFDWIDEDPSECCDLPHYDTINNGFDEFVFKKIHFL